jgi:hypothetical protein
MDNAVVQFRWTQMAPTSRAATNSSGKSGSAP